MRSSLHNLPIRREMADAAEQRKLARAAWHTHGLIMLRPEWMATQLDRELLLTLTIACHGEREP
jgi:hypothetical protein